MSEFQFGDLTDIYDSMIDWDKRLAHEGPFYRKLFERIGARRVLDAACGTGRHAAIFRSWGLSVEGADISQAMLDRARQVHGESEDLRWVLRGFDQPARAGAFDVAVCVGNSLALAKDYETAGQAVARMLEAVRPGGAVVAHVLNLWRLADGPCVWQKVRRVRLGDEDVMIHKGVHRSGDRGYVELLVTSLGMGPELRSESVGFLGIEGEWLREQAMGAGARGVVLWGGYRDEAYSKEKSQDLILVAER